MKLDKKTKILDLLETNPDLIDLLVTLSPEFKKLKNPLLRKTLGRFATLEHAAQTSGVPFEELSRKIAEMEQSLLSEGISEEEIKNLCDVHVQVFAESFEGAEPPQVPAGHPVDTFRRENEALGEVAMGIQNILADTVPSPGDKTRAELTSLFRDLAQIEKHYLRKENQLFPMLEKHGVSGPSKVMWALHDDIRAVLKDILRAVEAGDWTTVNSEGPGLITVIVDMIYKEENILFPMAMETLSQADWGRVLEGSEELGFALIEPDTGWQPESGPLSEAPPPRTGGGEAPLWLSTGGLDPKQLDLILTSLPVDITFVDARDKVQYYSAQPDRIFPRSPGIIGREVQNCHPPSSVHVVQEILNDFREGKRDAADFWIQIGGKFILIRYFAIRDKEGEYEGCLEVSQDVTDIRALTGEKRLLD